MSRYIFRLAGVFLVLLAAGVQAQDYPNRPVRLVVPFPPGGTLDIVGRLLAKDLQELWGQPVVIDNRAGAAGNIGVDVAAKSAPDGYTMVIVAPPVVTTPHLQKVPFDVTKDLIAVVQTALIEYVFVVHPRAGVNTLDELVAAAKKDPKRFAYASAGTGSGQHLNVELVRAATGIELNHIPYKGSAPALQAIMAGEVDLMFETSVSILGHIRSGKMKPLLVTGTRPLEQLPGVPAMGALFPQHHIDGWHGIMVPAGTPRPVVDRIAADVRRVVLSPAVATKFRELGFQPTGAGTDEFSAIVRRDLERWGTLIRANRITAN